MYNPSHQSRQLARILCWAAAALIATILVSLDLAGATVPETVSGWGMVAFLVLLFAGFWAGRPKLEDNVEAIVREAVAQGFAGLAAHADAREAERDKRLEVYVRQAQRLVSRVEGIEATAAKLVPVPQTQEAMARRIALEVLRGAEFQGALKSALASAYVEGVRQRVSGNVRQLHPGQED